MDLDSKVNQVEFAEVVGISKQAVSAHVQAGVLHEGGSLRVWLRAYCDRLRVEAAGRAPSDARERRDMAAARKDEVQAQLAERELYRQDGLIVDIESVRHAMTEWAAVARNEFLAAVENAVTAIESQHGITVERAIYQTDIDAALRAIGSYALESVAPDHGSSPHLDTEAASTAD